MSILGENHNLLCEVSVRHDIVTAGNVEGNVSDNDLCLFIFFT